jgi:DUF1680 family protein
MKKKRFMLLALTVALTISVQAQGGLVDTGNSRYAIMNSVPLGSTHWTGGFWGDRFGVLSKTSLQSMWNTWDNPEVSHGFRNFEVAAGTVKGVHHGPPFHDGDMYKWLEGVATVYAVTHDSALDALMDKFIEQVAKAQMDDGYIHTPVVIKERFGSTGKDNTVVGIKTDSEKTGSFASRMHFETYNLGHLMTAGVVHFRATGKRTLLDCGIKAADFLYRFYKEAPGDLARNAICPSHYMGAAEIYRATGDPKYLELAEGLINIRDMVENGEDHNQDRIPFRKQYEAMGHAVRANYLYAGVADLYNEIGEEQLLKNLTSIWNDIVEHKLYITGGCGALYDGVSPDGTTYNQPSIQQIHQAYGRSYQLPNETSHNETCADIGLLLFSWRLFTVTGDARYADMVENELYNGILSGISLDGEDYFYTNALRKTAEFPYTMRWPKSRQRYISCFCCPPNTFRTLCQAQEYAYSVSDGTLWCNLYGENTLKTKTLQVTQHTGYPYDGNVTLIIDKAKQLQKVKLRIPGWCTHATLLVNGEPLNADIEPDTYVEIERKWKKGDKIELSMDMHVKILEANPLVEESRNQIAVKRGPIVYCLEGADIEGGGKLTDVVIPGDIEFTPCSVTLQGHQMTGLEGMARMAESEAWGNQLYREMRSAYKEVKIRLIPYYAWGNRGETDMSVWLPVSK